MPVNCATSVMKWITSKRKVLCALTSGSSSEMLQNIFLSASSGNISTSSARHILISAVDGDLHPFRSAGNGAIGGNSSDAARGLPRGLPPEMVFVELVLDGLNEVLLPRSPIVDPLSARHDCDGGDLIFTPSLSEERGSMQ